MAVSRASRAAIGTALGHPVARLSVVALGASLCCMPVPALARASRAAAPVEAINISLADVVAGHGGFTIDGHGLTHAGQSVAGAGDVNGDGIDDVVVGAPAAGGGPWYERPGAAYVVFGSTNPQPVDLGAIEAGSSAGFVIHGDGVNLGAGMTIAGVGDVNGDGIADVAVGIDMPYGAPNPARRAYIVFGKTGHAPVELTDVAAGVGGFAILAPAGIERTGLVVGAAGDFDGDGLADVIVSASYSQNYVPDNRTASYVVFGKKDTKQVLLKSIGAGQGGGVAIGHDDLVSRGSAVAGAGDVNGDGLADLVIGVPTANFGAGRGYVVFGRPGTAPISLADIDAGSGGFRMNGFDDYDAAGTSVAAAGDVNGDGLADVLVGAPSSYWKYGRAGARGYTYVVFGRTSTAPVDLIDIESGDGGFVIVGEGIRYDFSGTSVAGIGDVNGDGLADILLGAPEADALPGPGGYYGGRSYVVYGKADTAHVMLSDVTAGNAAGFTIYGEGDYARLGTSVGAAGDVNGDGLADLIVGAPERELSPTDAGRTYVVFGATGGAFAPTAIDQFGTPAGDTLAGSAASETLAGGAGADLLQGNGGADDLWGGPGDDTLVLGPGTVKALRSPLGSGGNTARLARVDGGPGFDTLALAGANVDLDLRAIADPGAGLPGSLSRLASIERIDLTGSGDNRVHLSSANVQHLAGMNLLNAGNQAARGWSSGSYQFPATVRRHQLVVDGDAGDRLFGEAGAWRNAGTVLHGSQAYTVWNSVTGRAQVLMNANVQRGVDPPPAAGARAASP